MPPSQTAPPKRRKVRKGTFSCWECKHRKTRCEFKPSCSVCVSCRQRGLACVSQEYDVESSNTHAQRRMDRMEDLVDQLVMQRNGFQMNIPIDAIQSLVPNPSPGVSVSSYLHSIFPPHTTATAILENGRFIYMPIRMWDTREPLEQVSQRPQPLAHPVQFARKLILFALCLQQLESSRVDANRYLEIVSRYVTSQDVMLESVDGIETIMMEASYYINSDNLRAAWLKFRRAISFAQLIGLDQMKGERERNVWLRLMSGDHYMSLIMGLSPAVADSLLEPPWDSELDLQQVHLVISSRIIARNIRMQRFHLLEYQETQDIDRLLQHATKSLPSGWWSFRPLDEVDEAEVMRMTARLSAQIHHQHFVIFLHQPYLLRDLCSSTNSGQFSYSKAALPPSCREVLLRSLTYRRFHRTLSYRGSDEKAFTAATTLLLAHIDGHRLSQANVLGHQRPQDLAANSEFLDLIDEIVGSSSPLPEIRALMKIESEIANGAIYQWNKGDGAGLELKIPFFGSLCAVRTDPHPIFDNEAVLTVHPESLHAAVDTIENVPHIGAPEDPNTWECVTLGEAEVERASEIYPSLVI